MTTTFHKDGVYERALEREQRRRNEMAQHAQDDGEHSSEHSAHDSPQKRRENIKRENKRLRAKRRKRRLFNEARFRRDNHKKRQERRPRGKFMRQWNETEAAEHDEFTTNKTPKRRKHAESGSDGKTIQRTEMDRATCTIEKASNRKWKRPSVGKGMYSQTRQCVS